jgi:excisionase family DNA binding protein
MMSNVGHVGGRGASAPQFFTVRAIADQLDISSRTVHRRIKNNELIAHRIGRSIRISEVDLKQYLAVHRDGD